MNRRAVRIIIPMLLQTLAVTASRAQGTVTPSPNLVRLTELWRKAGGPVERFGGGIGGRVDVNGDGYGDFFGDGRPMIGFGGYREDMSDPNQPQRFDRFMFHEVKSGAIADIGYDTTGDLRCVVDAYAIDLDREPGDELAIVESCEGEASASLFIKGERNSP